MVTPPKKLPSSLEQSAIKQRHSTTNVFPRVVQVEEAQHQGAPAGLFSSGQKKDCKTVAEDNITVETLSDVDLSPADGQVNPQPAHIQLTLPSAEPSVSEGSLELNFDDTVDVSSTSGGEITSVPLNQTIFI